MNKTLPDTTMAARIDAILAQLNTVIFGKPGPIRLSLACLLARGHLLVEDLPGVGKTTLAHALARTLGLQFQRVQFTSDLLPADILGVSVFSTERKRFEFHPGPVFSQLVLADEINRATPKSQSALLEAMEEQQVTIEGTTRRLPEPFFVIATQNPQEQIGTFPLPESQMDRFLMRIHLGYPDAAAERALLRGRDRRELVEELPAQVDAPALLALQRQVTQVHVSDGLLDYLQAIVAHTRRPALYQMGLSPRAALALMRAAQAWALVDHRDHVLPEDIQAVLPPVAGHRLKLNESPGLAPEQVTRRLIEAVPVP
ncbi:AAA family ATPase [Ectothiorhodospira lacustris]|uniref:AAA family ATPase n=1 Tax=Ectothiorhodospira lacustris TaxID=2899127 RepID=UPI001EE81FA7|nr:MoxR family ATPase [Ectothiorhodospira lacustris]MCG5501803.1 MoxR family ATPase [Ectothiorhodospira lacustris]MCG5509973.1 MoxR family ATPase [Ectothiorhodospira lacustris]MCG5521719.1 MoxR family ATPase [Ectothiorhodospira lacustris]